MRCDVCGFDFGQFPTRSIGNRASASARATSHLLRSSDEAALRFLPYPGRWTAVEYGAHIRDVFLTIRDRLVIGLVEDDPGFKPMYRDERVDRGLYASDTPADVANELDSAMAMFVRLFEAIDEGQLDRTVRYGFPDPQPRTLRWMGVQAVHESEHHHADIVENLAAFGGVS